MSSEVRRFEGVHHRYAWIILFALGLLLSLSTLAILVGGANPPMQFEVDTGVPWAVFAGDYPTVATLVSLQELLIGTGFLSGSLFATIVAFSKYRRGERWAWYIMWILPGMLGLAALLFFTHAQAYVGYYYLGAVALAVLGLLAPIRKFFGQSKEQSSANER
jgi:hypothetical protein